ncbi:MAG: zinc-finger domain-containing protein, partial [Pseudomonadota bacterium]|nr:zinc-finger domain-containing protein [Pseudomonadota bacterium]
SKWNAHPRVFLTLDEEGKAVCPYCSTVYILQDD